MDASIIIVELSKRIIMTYTASFDAVIKENSNQL